MTRHLPPGRRTFLIAGGLGYFGCAVASRGALTAELAPARRKAARSAIMI
jgi:hypothetical protein